MSPQPQDEQKIRVLIVEDEIIVARDLRGQLAELGYLPVGDTAFGDEAVGLARQLRPDVVLMDVNLAGAMDGIAAAQAIRDELGLPVVFLTAFADHETLERAKQVEPYGYIIKPFDAHSLRVVIDLAISKHRAELALRNSEVRYRALVDSARDAIVTADWVGNIVGWNRAATLAFGWTEAEMVGQPLTVVMPTFNRQAFLGDEPAADSQGGTAELSARRKDGSDVPVELAVSAWSSPGGRFVTGIIRDVSERKRAGQQIRLISTALEAAVNSVVITDPRGVIEWVNPAFCRITGYTREEVVGRNPRVLKSGRQTPEYYAEMWRTISGGGSWQGEFVNRRKDGSTFTEEVAVTPVRDGAGRIAHFVAIKQDISALKRTVEELAAAHAELEKKNQALDAALGEARAAADAKADFLATMSHELRTPLNGVLGMTSLLRASAPLTDEQVEFIETITCSGDALLALINDVLDFSKIGSGHLKLEQVPFDLRMCLEQTLESVAPRAREKGLDLALEVGTEVVSTVVGDTMRLRQVVGNLVGNAVKFTERGEVAIEVRGGPVQDGRQRIFFRVRDTGIGIAANKLDRLFKSFTQLDSSTTRVYGGTGLGLAISQRLVELMGGKIQVNSTPRSGSVFFFELDLPAAPGSERLGPARNSLVLHGCRVLIVDDNETSRRVLALQLQQASGETHEADSGDAALAWLREHPWPDLIVTDMLMPEMDGLEFALRVREWERARSPVRRGPIGMVTSGGSFADDPRQAGAGLAFTLLKPLRQGQLIEAVARACALPPAQRAERPPPNPANDLSAIAARHPRRILLAEDNSVNRKIVHAMLGRMGYAIDIVQDGTEVLEACRQKTYDLILMDVQMPEMDGLEATRRLRRIPGVQPLIIAMTANALDGDREICLAAGMDDYVPKPIRSGDLQKAVMMARKIPQPEIAASP